MATGYSRSIIGGSDSFRGSLTDINDKIIDYTCNPCEDRSKRLVKATFYCSVCVEFYCQSCMDVHKKIKAYKRHTVYGRDQIKKWDQQVERALLPTEICHEHHGKVMAMLCVNHKALCCSTCVTLNHRDCSNMEYVPKIAKGIKTSQDMHSVGQTIDQFLKCVDDSIESGQKEQISLDYSKTEYLDGIKDAKRHVNDLFNDIEKKASKELDDFHNVARNDLQQYMKSFEESKYKLKQLEMAIQPANINNESQLFIELLRTHQSLPEFKAKLQNSNQTPPTSSFHLPIIPEIQEILTITKSLWKTKVNASAKQGKIPNIPQLSILQTQSTDNSIGPFSEAKIPSTPTENTIGPFSEALQVKKKNLHKAPNEREINVKMTSDKYNCDILGSCQMPNGDILLTDYNNKRVKRLNKNYEPTDYLDLPESPYAICCLSENKAVATCDKCKISFLTINKCQMWLIRSISMKHNCYGIAHHYGRILVSDGYSKVYVYETIGNYLKTIIKDNNGQNMFKFARHIAVNPDRNEVYVADRVKGLVILDCEGNHISTYKSQNLRDARDVCVDSQGGVLLCGWESGNVLYLDDGGRMLVGEVVSREEGIPYPKSICIDRHNSRLIVTFLEYQATNNHIKVFDLE